MLEHLSDLGAPAPHLDGGYCAPYLYLLKEADQAPARGVPYTKRKLAAVQRAINEGCGQGRGEAYRPWIRITRRFSSPASHQVFAALSVHRRNHHFLSKLEHHTALVLAYLGATEIRECLPMWPTQHPHPWLRDADDVPGLLEIADEAGIDHGTFVGTTVPYIGSLDIMLEMPWRGGVTYVGVSCKPDAIHDASPRAKERVELDRRYCDCVGAHHVREGGQGLNETLIKNLAAYRPLHSELMEFRTAACLSDFCGEFAETSRRMVLHEAITEAGLRLGLHGGQASMLWRIAIWLHRIDIDLTRPVSMSRQIRPGGGRVRAALEERFLGGAQ